MGRTKGERDPKIHESMEQPVCPLCGADLGIPAVPILPCTTLTRLARHFADDCPKTRDKAWVDEEG